MDPADRVGEPDIHKGCVQPRVVDAELATPIEQTALGRASSVAAYVGMLAGGIAVFFLVRSYGEALTAPPPAVSAAAGGQAATAAAQNALPHVLLVLVAVIVVGRVLGSLLRSVGQPPVIGEVLGGILLGPSLLGRVAPGIASYILPPAVAPYLSVIAELGVILYMFLVGLELNGDLLRRRAPRRY